MGVFEKFGSDTTFHGPNHAANASHKWEKLLWVLLFTAGLAATVHYCSKLVNGYVMNHQDELDVKYEATPNDVGYQQFPLMFCRDSWVNWTLVKSKPVPPKMLLFALSLIPSLKKRVLNEMRLRFNEDELPAEDKIWGLPKQDCSLESGSRKKRLLGGLGDLAGGLVETLGSTLTSLLGALGGEEGIVELINTIGDFGDPILPIEMILNGTINGTEAAHMLKLVLEKKLCTCDIDFEHMVDWQANADAFTKYMTDEGFETLTEFLSSIAYNVTDIYQFDNSTEIAETRWRVFDGQVCHVISFNLTSLKKKTSSGHYRQLRIRTPLGKSVDDYLSNPYEKSDRVKTIVVPFGGESSYERLDDNEELPQEFTRPLESAFEPFKLLSYIFRGKIPAVGIKYRRITHDKRLKGCEKTPEGRWYPRGYGKSMCEKRCRHRVEKRDIESWFNCTFVHSYFVNDVPVDRRICPGILREFADTRSRAEITAAEESCMRAEGCGTRSQEYCDHWEVDARMVDIDEEPKLLDTGRCDIDSQLSTLLLVAEFPVFSVSERKAKYDEFELLGIIGGISGLFIGASILTIVHALVFWIHEGCKWVYTKGKGRKNEVDSDENI